MLFQLAVPAVFLLSAADDPKKELEKLQGTWVLVGGEEKGVILTEDEARREKESVVFKGDKMTHIRGKPRGTCTVRIDPKTKPSSLDLIFGEGQVNHAIYSLEGDRLTICVSKKFKPNSPKERPTKFTTKREENGDLSGLVMGIYKRQKE